MRTLYLIRGLPGAGKSEFAVELELAFAPEAVRISLDRHIARHGRFEPGLVEEWNAADLVYCRELMSFGQQRIIVDNVFARAFWMRGYTAAAKECGYLVRSLIVENRHGGSSEHRVPETVIRRYQEAFEIKLR